MSALSGAGLRLRRAALSMQAWRRRPRLLAEAEHPWRSGLPPEREREVVTPRVFELAIDYEVAAERVLGRDADGEPCYCSYHCVLTDLCCEDGEVFFEALSFSENMRAWRLASGQWLVRRAVTTPDDPELERVEYRRSDTMPR